MRSAAMCLGRAGRGVDPDDETRRSASSQSSKTTDSYLFSGGKRRQPGLCCPTPVQRITLSPASPQVLAWMRTPLRRGNTVEGRDRRGAPRAPRCAEKGGSTAGYEPSGEVHLGHMVTVNKLLDLKEAGFEVVVLLADLHAFLNRKGTMAEVRALAEYNRRCFEGLRNSSGVEYVLGTELQLERDYVVPVLQASQSVTLARARRSMDRGRTGHGGPDPSRRCSIPSCRWSTSWPSGSMPRSAGSTSGKIHMLAREHLPELGYRLPVCLHTPILKRARREEECPRRPATTSRSRTRRTRSEEDAEGLLPARGGRESRAPGCCSTTSSRGRASSRSGARRSSAGTAPSTRTTHSQPRYGAGQIHPADLKKGRGRGNGPSFLRPVRDYLG